jgi:hypothetical protein
VEDGIYYSVIELLNMSECNRSNYFDKFFSISTFVLLFIFRSALRNWELQASKDGTTWTTLRKHKDDTTLNEPG